MDVKEGLRGEEGEDRIIRGPQLTKAKRKDKNPNLYQKEGKEKKFRTTKTGELKNVKKENVGSGFG